MTQIPQVNCSPIRPAFKGGDRSDIINAAANILREVKGGELDEDTIERIRDKVENIEDDPESKIRGPLKNFALTVLALGTGALGVKATAGKAFYSLQKSAAGPKVFNQIAKLMDKSGHAIEKYSRAFAKKAMNPEASKAVKVKNIVFKAINYVTKKVNPFLEKGIEASKGTVEFARAKAEKLAQTVTEGLGAITGATTTALALNVDKNKDGTSDILQTKDKKKEREAITELATTVLDMI